MNIERVALNKLLALQCHNTASLHFNLLYLSVRTFLKNSTAA